MNRRRAIIAIALSVILMQVPALAQTPAGTTKPADTSADTIKGYPVEKKNEAVAHGKKLMSDFDTKIKALESQVSRDMSAAGADVKRQMNELKDLKAAQAETSKKLDEMGKASSQSWNDAKQAFADSYKDLSKAYNDAIAKVRK